MSILKRRRFALPLLAGDSPSGRRGLSCVMVLPACCRLNWVEISLAALLLALGMLSMGRTASASSPLVSPLNSGSAVYLPMISANTLAVANQACDLNEQEEAIARLMTDDSKQKRAILHCNPLLSRVARDRAKDMATRAYFDHVNPDGHGPNYMVREGGFRLPEWYDRSDRANNVESIGGGFKIADAMWQAWLGSEYHRIHVLGSISFYAEQEEIGIGFYEDPNSPYNTYWVVITAPTETEQ